jgi:hypothetical protein
MNKIITAVAATGLAATFSLAAVAPASADQAAATRNEIIGGLAVVAGIAAIANANNQPHDPYQYGYQAYPDRGYDSGWNARASLRDRGNNRSWNNDGNQNDDRNGNGGRRDGRDDRR